VAEAVAEAVAVQSNSVPQRWLVAVTEYAGLTEYTGGIGRHYAALLPALVRLGISVDLIVFSDSAPAPNADLAGVNLVGFYRTGSVHPALEIPLRALRVRRAYLRASARVRRRTRDDRRGAGARHPGYDRVFLPEWAALGSLLPRSAPLLTNLATSMRLANEVAELTMRDLPRSSRPVVAVQNRLEDRQIRRSAGLISISRAMLEWTERSLSPLPPARIVRNCVDVVRVAEVSRTAPLPEGWPLSEEGWQHSEEGDARDAPVILFLGRLERRKGVVDAMQAFARVAQQFPRARLVLAGASGDSRFEPDRAALLSHLPPALHSHVTWLGHVASDSLYRGIHHATVTICPSRWEGFGNVALEAKAIGAALVCTTGSGFDDFCTHDVDCLMVPPANPASLAEAINSLLVDAALVARLGSTAAAGVAPFAPDPVAVELVRAADAMLGVTF
jgi:glycogen(starch) synthase